MRKILILLLLLLSTINLQAQFSCDMPDAPANLKSASTECGNMLNYSVYPNYNFTPIKYVRVSFDVIQKSDGTGSFVGSDEQICSYFKTMIDSVNLRMGNIQLLYPTVTSPLVTDTRIRIQYNNTYIYKNDSLYNYTLLESHRKIADSIYYNVIQMRTDLSTIDKSNTLHIILLPLGQGTFGGQASGFGSKKWIVLKGYDYSYNCAIWGTGKYDGSIHEVVGHLIHEIGHSLGLYHNFQGGANGTQCDDCADNGCPIQCSSNNYMDYTDPSYKRNAFSECQISKIHYYLSGMSGNIKDCYVPDYCQFDISKTINIVSGQAITWNSVKNLLGNLTISGSLTIKCNISIPKGGKVIVNSGGKLIVQGDFKNGCSETWGGIEVLNGGYLELNNTSISDFNISVKNGGTLRILNSLNVLGNNSIDIENGGYICFDNTSAINLQDVLSVINLHNNYRLGVNTAFITNPGTCLNLVSSIIKTGSGSINLFNSDQYIQNEIISANRYIPGNNISAGTNVTTTKPQGPVIIQKGANVVFDADGDILLDKGFEVQLGGTFEAK